MLIAIITFMVGVLGAALVAYGAWLLMAPAGFITTGFFLLLFSYMAAKNAVQPEGPMAASEDN